MKVNYKLEFAEQIEDTDQIKVEEIEEIAKKVKKHMFKWLKIGGFNILDSKITLELDLEDEN